VGRALDEVRTRRRLYVVAAVLGVMALLPLVKLVGVQLTDASALAARGRKQGRSEVTIPAMRGSILDRNGVELAISVPRSLVAVDRVKLTADGVDDEGSLREFGTRLGGLLGVDPQGVVDALVGSKATSRWVVVARTADVDKAAAAVEELRKSDMADSIMIDPTTERIHPSGESGVRIIGTVGADGPGPRAGVEASYDDVLQGHDGTEVVERDPDGETITGGEHVKKAPRPGKDVQVTLDRTLQYETEQILTKGAANSSAVGGIAIIGRPSTGELLAVAGVERNPQTGEMELSQSPLAFSNAYQAGSVFKLVTTAAAYEAGVIDDSSTFRVPDSIQVSDRTFTDNEDHATETMDVDDIVAHSSNVGTIEISKLLGARKLDAALQAFGFGRTSGIAHPAESPGLLPAVGTWTAPDTAAAAIGTFQSTTVLQLWAAYNVIANQGVYVPPRLVEGTVGADGTLDPTPARPSRRVVSASTAAKVQRALRAVVQEGTGKQWDLPGFPVAAKTGTGRMPSPRKVAKDDDYKWPDGMYHHVSTFAGYLPADHPQVSITVMLLDTAQGLTGSTSAGPVFSDLAKLAIRELSIAPTNGADVAAVDGADPTAAQPSAAQPAGSGATSGGRPIRSAPATDTAAATSRDLVSGGNGNGNGNGTGRSGGASTRSAATSTTMAPSKSRSAATGTG
jgi:cell division protein FtsI (penicillin-binding protein 3)